MDATRFLEQLKRQMAFLARSCAAFDEGFRDESIRIATTIRVLFHDTNKSTSLMTHLNQPQIRILSTCPAVENGMVFFGGGLSVARLKIGIGQASEATYEPLFDRDPELHRLIPRNEWWAEHVYLFNDVLVSRRDIVLAAANRDGGAHVDASLPAAYETIRDGLFCLDHEVDGAVVESIPVTGGHLSDLRQIAFEVLNSPDVIALVS